MPKFDSVPNKKKTFNARHLEPGEFQLDYILLPYGYSYNAEWAKAKKGDLIRFYEGGLFRIYSVRAIKMKGGLAELLSRIRYGISIYGCLQRWKENAKLEGNASTAVSTTECLWVIYEKVGSSINSGLEIQDRV